MLKDFSVLNKIYEKLLSNRKGILSKGEFSLLPCEVRSLVCIVISMEMDKQGMVMWGILTPQIDGMGILDVQKPIP